MSIRLLLIAKSYRLHSYDSFNKYIGLPHNAFHGFGTRIQLSNNIKSIGIKTMINTEIKPFNATAFKEGQFVEVSEKDVKGKWAIFFFYPADFTFVCPTELGDVADNYAELQKMGVEVYSVSTDTHFTHKAWHDSSDTIGKINYYMLGDQTGQITNNFGVMREGQGLADRATFLVDPEGVIQAMEITAEGIGRDADDLMRKVKAAQYVAAHPGEVCPAKWKEGEATLAPSLDLVGKI